MFLIQTIIYLLSFIAIWLGAGLIVRSADRFSHKLRLSSFAVSFFILGMLTSTPEFAVGITSVAEGNPEVFVGNLIGGIPVIFLFIIPILAIFGNGVKLTHQLSKKNLLLTLGVILAPSLAVGDENVTLVEGIILILLYIILFYVIEREKGVFDTNHSNILNIHSYSYKDILKVLLGVAIVFVSSQFIVDKTLLFADILRISPFYISLIILSLGTNLPELSLAVRSVISGKKDVAFGDYLGSAAANTFLFGLFTVMSVGETFAVQSFFKTFIILLAGLSLFYFFSRSKNDISRKEGIILLSVYIIFVIFEVFFATNL
ncbi:sodium:calcium antiporter [Candidatus Gottesmanbacteria bacterium]|nr:sodium:calcium antiporter [Candidatus Gottesmanbacteria bacterium]